MAIIREISDSNLETERNDSKSGVSRIIRESWQACLGLLENSAFSITPASLNARISIFIKNWIIG